MNLTPEILETLFAGTGYLGGNHRGSNNVVRVLPYFAG
jgi:hypothetical protein